MLDGMRSEIINDLRQWDNELNYHLNRICDGCETEKPECPCEPGEDCCKKVADYEEMCRWMDELHATRKRIGSKRAVLPGLPQLELPFEVVA